MNVEEFKETFLQHMSEDEQKVSAAFTFIVKDAGMVHTQFEGNGNYLVAALKGTMLKHKEVADIMMLSVINAMVADENLRDKFTSLLMKVQTICLINN